MKYLSKLTLVFLLGIIGLFAQAPDTAGAKTYGGSLNDIGSSVQQTSDGGYIVVGYTLSYGSGNSDVILIKTDTIGDTLWMKTYGGGGYEGGESVWQTTDGGYIVAGYADTSGMGFYDVYLIKTDTIGDTLWTRIYDWGLNDMGCSVQQTTDDGYIVAGYTDSYDAMGDIYLFKTDTIGHILWTEIYGGDDLDAGFSVRQTTDGGYIVTGYTQPGMGEYTDIYLLKTDSVGDSLWAKTYGGTAEGDNQGKSVRQTTDGGYIVAGNTRSSVTSDDIYLIKTDSLGDSLWAKTYGGSEADRGASVQQTTDGGYIVAGSTRSYGQGGFGIYLVKTDSIGDTLWTSTYGGSSEEEGLSVQQTSDGGYIVAGYTLSYGAGNADVYLIKIKSEEAGIEEKITSGLLSLFPPNPNPFINKTTVSYELTKASDVNVSIYNLLGQEVKKLYSGEQSSGVHSVTWDGSGNSGKQPTGIYLIKIKAGDEETSLKLTLIK
jgi:hypothetical protein